MHLIEQCWHLSKALASSGIISRHHQAKGNFHSRGKALTGLLNSSDFGFENLQGVAT